MKSTRAIVVALTTLLALSAISIRAEVPVLKSVLKNLDHAQTCLDSGQIAEAQAYANTATFLRPIRVQVQNDSMDVMSEAFNIWESALGYQIQFDPSTEGFSDLTIDFKNRVPGGGHDVLGLATTRRSVHAWAGGQFTTRVTGSIEIATMTLNGLPMTRDLQLNIALHEIGHFLGLDDTIGLNQVMSQIDLDHPVTQPSQEEYSTISLLQQQACEIAQSSVGLLAGR